VREVSGFGLSNVPCSNALAAPLLPRVVPMVFHGSSRQLALASDFVALPLARMFNRRDGSPRHLSRESLCAAYSISPNSTIILSGTDVDAPLERLVGVWRTQTPRTYSHNPANGRELYHDPKLQPLH
jgi:hypothetical protein